MNKLSVKIIGSIIILVTLITVTITIFSYQIFTKTTQKEMAAYVVEIAKFASMDSLHRDFQDYLDMGDDRIREVLELVFEGKNDEVPEEEFETINDYMSMQADLTNLCVSQGIDQMAIYIPDESKGFTEATVIFAMKKDYEQNKISLLPLGSTVKLNSQKEYTAMRKIWDEGSEQELIIDYDGDEETKPYLSVFRGVHDAYNNLVGVLVVTRNITDMVDTWRRYLIGSFSVVVAITLIGVIMLGLYLRQRVVKPVGIITKESHRFAKESIKSENELVDNVGKVTEIRILAESIDKMEEGTVENINEISRMSRESERMDTELALAANLQKSVLPKGEKLSERREFNVAASMSPAREVGGDFYDFFLIDDRHLVLLIADVSDKGVGAAFFMAVSKTLIKARASMGGTALEVITFAEERLSEDNEEGMFITAWLGIIDLMTGEVNACNAGHNFPAILKKDTEEGYRIEKTVHGPPICFLPGMGFEEYNFRLHPGDRIFLYTDGVTEAKAENGDRFGNDRLIQALNEDRTTGDESLILRVKAAVDHFAGEERQFDDITLVSFTYNGV